MPFSLPRITNLKAIASLVLKELYRRKDFYALFIMIAVITLGFASFSFIDNGRIVRFLKEICLGLIWISSLLIAITTTARQIPSECESRTIFPLLAKPITRTEVILGKFFGCWFASGISLLLFYIFFCGVAISREDEWHLLNYLQAGLMHWFMLGIVISIVLTGSMFTSAISSNITICSLITVGILLMGRSLNKIALQQDEPAQSIIYGLYYIIPHLEFFDLRNIIIHNWPLVSWWACGAAALYAMAYTCIFLSAACIRFHRIRIQ